MANERKPTPAELKEHQRVMRELRQQGQAAVTWGLPDPATEAAVLGMGLIMRDKLADGASDDRAAAAAALASTMLDKTLQRMPQAAAVQCARGCSYCCHSAVTVSAPEVFRIVRVLSSGGDEPDALETSAVIERARARTRPTVEAVLSLRHPCPLLLDGECSVYDARPMGCRQFLSTDVAGCKAAFERDAGQMPYIPAAANAGLIMRSLLMGAAASLGRTPELYELSRSPSPTRSAAGSRARTCSPPRSRCASRPTCRAPCSAGRKCCRACSCRHAASVRRPCTSRDDVQTMTEGRCGPSSKPCRHSQVLVIGDPLPCPCRSIRLPFRSSCRR
jgi:Fe-S-cluster containining protein